MHGDDVEKTSNNQVVEVIKNIQKDPDTDYGYRKMTFALMILGYIINHKKVYRLMKENLLLKDFAKKMQRTFVKYRKVLPTRPLVCPPKELNTKPHFSLTLKCGF